MTTTILAGGVLLLAVLVGWSTRKHGDRTVAFVTALFVVAIAAQALLGYWFPPATTTGRYVRWICILVQGLAIIRLLGVALFRVVLPAARVVNPRIVEDVVVATGSVVWAGIWLKENGFNVTGLLATSAVVTAVIGLSLQDTLGNILGGVAIQFDRSIRVGDWLQLDDVVGRVVEIRWRHTSLETRDWETLVVPNSVLVRNRFRVIGLRQGQPVQQRRTVEFPVDFRYSPTQVIEAVESALRSQPIRAVAADPQPACLLLAFEDSFARYGVRYWLTNLNGEDAIDSEVRTHIYFALRRAGIPLSIPAQAVFLTQDTAERRASKAQREITERVAALRSIELFTPLQPEELERLAPRLVPTPFRAGEVIARQGERADCLFLLISGNAHVIVESHGSASKVAELGAGSFFGEMGLMTGEPRSATVAAASDVACLRLDKRAFEEILQDRPAIAEEIAQVLAQRKTELDMVVESLDSTARAERLSTTRQDILRRVRQFFAESD